MTNNRITYQRGVLSLDGQERFQLTADYPYYRDKAELWPSKLQRIREMGIEIITFYTPWRHHEVDGQLDFTGVTAGNRNVIGFLQLLQRMGFKAVLKPGPFIHAETDFGGLPDRLDFRVDDRVEPMRDSTDQTRIWHRPLPAPFGDFFQGEVERWYSAVKAQLIEPYIWPKGPIVALQTLNEGIYSDANRAFTAYDYAPSSLARFAFWQEERHRSPVHDAPRHDPGAVTKVTDLMPHLDWALYLGDYMSQAFQWGGAMLQSTGLPILSNFHPPEGDRRGTDWWLCKVVPERWGPVRYGFTNWIGCVSHDESAFYRYLVLVKRQPGPNLEENWGFSELYDSRYRFTVIPYFQTLLCIAAGATGFNVYTGAGTDGWDDSLDSHHKRPYPDTAPVGADLAFHPKAHTLMLLTDYLNRWGDEWLQCRSHQPVSWGIYQPYAALAGWTVPDAAYQALGEQPPIAGEGLNQFMRAMRSRNHDFGMVNCGDGVIDPVETPMIVMTGAFFMDAATQMRLLQYVRAGGTLLMLRELPHLDADLVTPCTLLASGLLHPGAGRFRLLPGNLLTEGTDPAPFLAALEDMQIAPAVQAGPETQAWIRRHPVTGVAHLVVLSLSDQPGEHHVTWQDGAVAVSLPGRSGALLRLEGGQLSAALVKGVNDCDGQFAVPAVRCAGESIQAPGVGDWLWIRGEAGVFQPWR